MASEGAATVWSLHGSLCPVVVEALHVERAVDIRGELLDGQRLARAVGVLIYLTAIAHPFLSEHRLLSSIRRGLFESLLLDEHRVDTGLEVVSLVASHLCGVVACPRLVALLEGVRVV